MFRTVEQLIDDLKTGTEELKADEYIGEDGLPYCKQCKTPRFIIIDGVTIDDKNYAIRSKCKCIREAEQDKEEQDRRRQVIAGFKNRQELSLLGERYQNARFNSAATEVTHNNQSVYRSCINYTAKAEEVLKENIGLYIYGENSTGKTYLTACMCNELVYNGWYCLYTNYASILTEIKSSYNGKGIGEKELFRRLTEYEFVFIDDFGKEFIGREYNAASSKWAEEKLFEIVNARYNAAKPVIFSSNFSLRELATVLKLDTAIVERVNEMSTRVFKLTGEDFRERNRIEKTDVAKKLGI